MRHVRRLLHVRLRAGGSPALLLVSPARGVSPRGDAAQNTPSGGTSTLLPAGCSVGPAPAEDSPRGPRRRESGEGRSAALQIRTAPPPDSLWRPRSSSSVSSSRGALGVSNQAPTDRGARSRTDAHGRSRPRRVGARRPARSAAAKSPVRRGGWRSAGLRAAVGPRSVCLGVTRTRARRSPCLSAAVPSLWAAPQVAPRASSASWCLGQGVPLTGRAGPPRASGPRCVCKPSSSG